MALHMPHTAPVNGHEGQFPLFVQSQFILDPTRFCARPAVEGLSPDRPLGSSGLDYGLGIEDLLRWLPDSDAPNYEVSVLRCYAVHKGLALLVS